jgi:argonaute-like protein implicated in RNA metabolism and viral defense
MSYENQYNETYQKMRKAYQKAEKTDENKDWEVYRCYVEEFSALCQEIVITLLAKDYDIFEILEVDEEERKEVGERLTNEQKLRILDYRPRKYGSIGQNIIKGFV